jgi:hypothetical protein
MGRTTEVAIATLPAVACLALLFGVNLLPELMSARPVPTTGSAVSVTSTTASRPVLLPATVAVRSAPSVQPKVITPPQVPTIAATPLKPLPRVLKPDPPPTAPTTTIAVPRNILPSRQELRAAAPVRPVPSVTAPTTAAEGPRIAAPVPAAVPAVRTPTARMNPPKTAAPKTAAPAAAPTPSIARRSTPRPAARPLARLAPAVSASPSSALTRGRWLTGQLYGQRLGPLWKAFGPRVQRTWISLPALEAYRARGLATYGPEQRVLSETVRQGRGIQYYLRTSVFERGPRQGRTLIFGLDPSGQVVSFGIVSAAAVPASARGRKPTGTLK